MRFISVALMGLLPLAFATPVANFEDELVERGSYKPEDCHPTIILNTLATIKTSVLKLDAGIKAINSSDLLVLLPLDGLATDVTNVVIAQIAKLKTAPVIQVNSVIYVANKAQNLIDTIVATIADLKKIRKYTIPSSTSGLVLADLTRLKGNADDYINALEPKVPAIAKFLVRVDKAQLDNAFDSAIAYFKVGA